MDLYIQIGILLLFLTALSLFIFIYTTPAQLFTAKVGTVTQTINDRTEISSNGQLNQFRANKNVSGVDVLNSIKNAKSNKIGVFVQTANQRSLVVNYGYQLRGANVGTINMEPYGWLGTGANNSSDPGTNFEKSYVTTANAVFDGNDGRSAPLAVRGGERYYSWIGDRSNQDAEDLRMDLAGKFVRNGFYPQGSLLDTSTNGNYSLKGKAPHLMFSDPTRTGRDAVKLGRTYTLSGLLFTDQVLKLDAPINENISYAIDKNSYYYIDPSSKFMSTVVVDLNTEIVGIYFEEYTVDPQGGALYSMDFANGTN